MKTHTVQPSAIHSQALPLFAMQPFVTGLHALLHTAIQPFATGLHTLLYTAIQPQALSLVASKMLACISTVFGFCNPQDKGQLHG